MCVYPAVCICFVDFDHIYLPYNRSIDFTEINYIYIYIKIFIYILIGMFVLFLIQFFANNKQTITQFKNIKLMKKKKD